MNKDDRGLLVFPRLRVPVNIALYLFIAAQLLVVLSMRRQSTGEHQFPSGSFELSLLYLGPAAIALGLKQHLRILMRIQLLSPKAFYICSDWVTTMLSVTYVILVKFRNIG